MPDRVRYFDGAPPRVIAHRGFASGAHENTLGAFQAAIDAGADILETDVHSSADGVAIIFHDDDLARVAGVQRRIEEVPADELLSLELPGGGRLSTLDEVLSAFPGVRFNIDVKTDAAVEPAIRAIRGADAEGRVLVTAFGQRRRRRVVRALRGSATSASTPGVVLCMLGTWLRLAPLVRLALLDVDAVQVPRRRGGIAVVTRTFVASVHAAGREVHVWTVNDATEMRELLDLGVDGLISDHCDVLREVVSSRSKRLLSK